MVDTFLLLFSPHILGRFAAEYEGVGMRVSTSKSEAMMDCPLPEFKYLGVLFTSEGRMEREIDRRIDVASAVMRGLHWTVLVGSALDLPVGLRSNLHLWS